MTGRRPEPVIGQLVPVCGSGILGSTTSPRSPLEITKIQSQKGLKRYDFGGSVGIGLGIVAALEKSEPVHHHMPVFARNRSRSIPVPEVEMEKDEENYTLVTCHGPNKTNTTITSDGDDYNIGVKRKENINGFDKKGEKMTTYGRVVFEISPGRFIDDVEANFPELDFISFCNLCRKKLHGKDIYMYRGEKAFCSEGCRKVEIVKDERKEKQRFGSKLVSSRSNTTTPTVAAATHISTTSPHYTTTTTNAATQILAT